MGIDVLGKLGVSGGSHHVLGDEYGADGESDEDADQDLGASSGSPRFSGGSHHLLGDEYGADGESDEDADQIDVLGKLGVSGGSHHVLGDEYGADGESDENADQDLGASSGSPK